MKLDMLYLIEELDRCTRIINEQDSTIRVLNERIEELLHRIGNDNNNEEEN